jgi:hypothetical protein
MKKIHLLFTVGQLFYYIYCKFEAHPKNIYSTNKLQTQMLV